MSAADLTALPTPDHLTLLLKHGKSTTVLSLLPSQHLTEVKATLLTALHMRNKSTFPNGTTPLPKDPKDFELAVLVDRRDPSKGWVSVEDGVSLAASKLNKKKSTSKTSGQIDTVGDLELKDGAWIAYRLKSPGDEILEDGSDDDIRMNEDPGWNVVIPSYDDEEEENTSMPNEPFTMPHEGGTAHSETIIVARAARLTKAEKRTAVHSAGRTLSFHRCDATLFPSCRGMGMSRPLIDPVNIHEPSPRLDCERWSLGYESVPAF